MNARFVQTTLFILAVLFLVGASVDWLIHHDPQTFGVGAAIAFGLGWFSMLMGE